MYTGKIFSLFPTRVVTGATDLSTHLVGYFQDGCANAIRRMFGDNGVFETQQTASYLVGPPDRISLAVGERHYNIDGSLAKTVAGSMEGCSSMAFHHNGAALYYIGLRHNWHPSNLPGSDWGVRQGKSGANVYSYTKYRDSIGEAGVPNGVSPDGAGLKVVLNTLCKSVWLDGGQRTVVLWLADPVTDGAEAIWEGVAEYDVVSGSIMAKVPHCFGQTTPSIVAADYYALVKGATITTVNITADTDYCFIGTFDCATDTFDYTGQNVITPAGVNSFDLWQLAQDLYPLDVPAPSLDHDGVANMAVSLGNLQRIDQYKLNAIFGIADFFGGNFRGFGRAAGIVLDTDRAGYVAFNPILGISEAAGTVTVALAKNTIDNHEVILTQGTPCTHKTATDWTNYQYVPAADGYYCVYFYAAAVSHAEATAGWSCGISTAIDAGAISPTDAMNRKLGTYVPLYGYEIAAGAMVNEVAFPLVSICGIGYQDKLQGQWEVRNEVIPIGHADLGVTATKVMNAPPTPSVEISLPAANDYCYIPIQFPAGYVLNEVLVDIDPDIAAGANNTVEGRLYRNGAAISAVYSWIGARTVLTVVPTAEVVYSAPAGAPDTGIVYLAIICTVHAGGDARVYGVSANFTRCME
jgi:hypothetical protein